jgi:hypothetical protein
MSHRRIGFDEKQSLQILQQLDAAAGESISKPGSPDGD